jgi:hypothetical protein
MSCLWCTRKDISRFYECRELLEHLRLNHGRFEYACNWQTSLRNFVEDSFVVVEVWFTLCRDLDVFVFQTAARTQAADD